MTYQEVLEQARTCMGKCHACPVCSGLTCKDGEDQDRHLIDMPHAAFACLPDEALEAFNRKYDARSGLQGHRHRGRPQLRGMAVSLPQHGHHLRKR